VPLIFELLVQLSKKNMLDGLFKEAVEEKKAAKGGDTEMK
jgi:hypothetical protein